MLLLQEVLRSYLQRALLIVSRLPLTDSMTHTCRHSCLTCGETESSSLQIGVSKLLSPKLHCPGSGWGHVQRWPFLSLLPSSLSVASFLLAEPPARSRLHRVLEIRCSEISCSLFALEGFKGVRQFWVTDVDRDLLGQFSPDKSRRPCVFLRASHDAKKTKTKTFVEH